MNLQFKVTEQELKRIDTNKPADLSNKYLKCQFTFNDEWENFIKFAIFRTKENNYRVTILNNECYVPFDVLAEQKFRMTVYGVNDDDVRITTNLLWISLVGSGFVTEYDESGEFNPDMTEQIWEAMAEKADKSELDGKADKTYVDSELAIRDEQISLKVDKSYVDTELDKKADKIDTYTKTEVDNRVNVKADTVYVNTELAGKVDKVTGKQLSTNDFNDTYKNKLDNLDSALNTKVDKISGKGLSTNDYTNTDKNKVALIDNKVDKVTGKGLSTNDFTDHYKNFLDGFDGDIAAFLLDHKEEIEALISQDVVDSKADKTYVDDELELKSDKTYVDELIHRIDNKFIIKGDKEIISTGDTVDLLAKIKEDGFPVASTMIHFFEKISPVISLSSSAQVIETGDDTELYARVRDTEDGSYAVNTKVHFFERITPAIKVSASASIIQLDEDADIYAKVYDEDGSLAQNMKVHFFKEDDEELINENIETNNLNNDMEEE